MWIWAAMYDLKVHVFYGKSYHVVQGAARIPIVLAITAITMASFLPECRVRVSRSPSPARR